MSVFVITEIIKVEASDSSCRGITEKTCKCNFCLISREVLSPLMHGIAQKIRRKKDKNESGAEVWEIFLLASGYIGQKSWLDILGGYFHVGYLFIL